MAFTLQAERRAIERPRTETSSAEPLLDHTLCGGSGLRRAMESESYYKSDGDIAYIRVRSPHGPVRSEGQPGGLRAATSGRRSRLGLEVWSASKVLPEKLVAAPPRLEGRGTGVEHQPA